MKMNSCAMIIGAENFNIPDNEADMSLKLLVGRFPGLSNPAFRQPVEALMEDMESIRLMEERYGIREEGIF
jgi:hypothetical protein